MNGWSTYIGFNLHQFRVELLQSMHETKSSPVNLMEAFANIHWLLPGELSKRASYIKGKQKAPLKRKAGVAAGAVMRLVFVASFHRASGFLWNKLHLGTNSCSF